MLGDILQLSLAFVLLAIAILVLAVAYDVFKGQ